MSKNTTQYGFKSSKKIKEHYTDGIQQVLNNIQPIFDITTLGASLPQLVVTICVIGICLIIPGFNHFLMVKNPYVKNININEFFNKINKNINNNILKWVIILLILVIYSAGLLNTSPDLFNKTQDIINLTIFMIMFLSSNFFNIGGGLSKLRTGIMAGGSILYVLTFISRLVAFILKKKDIDDKENVIKALNVINTLCILFSLICFVVFFLSKNK